METLGAATLIASDKTGTLTENRMTVQNVWFDGSLLPAAEVFHISDLRDSKTFKRFYHVAALCNRAYFAESGEETKTSFPIVEDEPKAENKSVDSRMPLRLSAEWKRSMERRRNFIVGDASETALLAFADKFKPVEPTREKYKKTFEIPFNSKNKYQLSIHEKNNYGADTGPSPRLLVMKGAPEIVMNRCTHYLYEGKTRPLDATFKKDYEKIYQQLGKLGERVLGLAFCEMPPDPNGGEPLPPGEKPEFPETDYTFVGVVSMVDPPKRGVAQAIQKCRTAGIRVVMVTGDHPFTAEAIARKVGIIQDGATRDELAKELKIAPADVEEDLIQAAVYTGAQVDTFTEEQWAKIVQIKELVFARTSPQHKVTIVEHFQQSGEVVAVTGDGVNDSIALNQSDIGVAMGLRGSDVAKEAADIVILDDNFASIVIGIEQGRVLFDNLKKTIAYTLTHLVPEVIPIVLTLTIGLPLGLASLLVLSIDLGTELAPAISLAYEKAEADVMLRRPRNSKKDRLVSLQLLLYSYLQVGIIESIACVFTYFFVFWWYGIPPGALVFTSKTYFKDGAPDWTVNGKVFTAADQLYILAVANGAYYITLVMAQMGHIWMCKTRTQSIFRHGVRNMLMNIGVPFSIAIMIIIVYVPGVQNFFTTATVNPIFWLPWVVCIIVIWLYAEIRKYFTRTKPKNKLVKLLTW